MLSRQCKNRLTASKQTKVAPNLISVWVQGAAPCFSRTANKGNRILKWTLLKGTMTKNVISTKKKVWNTKAQEWLLTNEILMACCTTKCWKKDPNLEADSYIWFPNTGTAGVMSKYHSTYSSFDRHCCLYRPHLENCKMRKHVGSVFKNCKMKIIGFLILCEGDSSLRNDVSP